MRPLLILALALPLCASTTPTGNAVVQERQRFAESSAKLLPQFQKAIPAPQLQLPSAPWRNLSPTASLVRQQVIVSVPERPCAVPLTNLIGPESSQAQIRQHRPGPGRYAAREVAVPAPSCDDLEKR
jgi:hypothetical protein